MKMITAVLNKNLLICVFSLLILFQFCCGSIFDYFPLGKSLFGESENDKEKLDDSSLQKVPYEVEVTDEKFIEQAAKFTGLSLSELDKCQHRVILKLQEECHKLNDEELSKLAVKLLNCQSAIEERKIYPCTDKMSIRDCTSSMDPDTWNSYLLMSNRARAVCYAIRQSQFRGLAELTVNKLMGAAHEQLDIMSRLRDGQFRIEHATAQTYDTVVQGNKALEKQQNDIRQAQFYGQLVLEDNIRRLADEKQLITDGHDRLAQMTKDVQSKLAEAARQLDTQSEERKENHKEILNDLIQIQQQAHDIFLRIEDSSRYMLEQSALAAKQYESTLAQLAQVNSTVYALVDVISITRSALEEKLVWLSEALGGTDDAVERLYVILIHMCYLIIAMISFAFVQISVPVRIALILLVPLNLFVALQQGTKYALSVIGMTAVLLSFITVQFIFHLALSYRQSRTSTRQALKYKNTTPTTKEENEATPAASTSKDDTLYESRYDGTDVTNTTLNDSFDCNHSYTYRRYDLDTTDNTSDFGEHHEFISPTPPLSRRGLSRSRSKTPLIYKNGVDKHICVALTRMGARCKSVASPGRDYCYRHQSGSSVIS